MGKPTESVQEYLKFESLSGADPQTIARLQEAFGKSGARGFWRRRLEDYRAAAKSGYVNAGMDPGSGPIQQSNRRLLPESDTI
jgi:hypothetical protein